MKQWKIEATTGLRALQLVFFLLNPKPTTKPSFQVGNFTAEGQTPAYLSDWSVKVTLHPAGPPPTCPVVPLSSTALSLTLSLKIPRVK